MSRTVLVQCLACERFMDPAERVARVTYDYHGTDPTEIVRYRCSCGESVEVETT